MFEEFNEVFGISRKEQLSGNNQKKKLFYLLSIIKDVKEYETHNSLGNVQRTLLIPEAVTSRYHDNKIFGSKWTLIHLNCDAINDFADFLILLRKWIDQKYVREQNVPNDS